MKLKFLLAPALIFGILLPCIAAAQTITTFAGNNTDAYSGDGGAATSASIGTPWFVTTDRAGNTYISDGTYSVVRKVSPAGVITTVAGNGTYGYSGDGGPATSAALKFPQQILIDTSGNLYIADDGNTVVRKVDTSGTISTFAGMAGITTYTGDGGPATSATMYGALGLAMDNAGNLYISDGQQYVRKVDTAGIISTYAGSMYGYSGDGSAATAAAMSDPSGLAMDAAGNLYIADNENNVIRKVNTSGIITTYAGYGTGLSGGGGYSGDNGPATAAKLNGPYGIATDKYGNLFIADQGNNLVRKVDGYGKISTVAGDTLATTAAGSYSGDGGLALAATLNSPTDVWLDSNEHLYIADNQNYIVREVTDGNITYVSHSDTICAGTSITFYATTLSAGPDVYYEWMVDGTNVGDTTASYTTDTLHGGDSVSFSVISVPAGNVIYTAPAAMITISTPVTPTISVSSPGGTTECPHTAFTFIASITNGGSAPVFHWTINDSGFVSGDTVTYLPAPSAAAAGYYAVSCTLITNAFCAIHPVVVSLPVNILIEPVVVPSVTITAAGGDTSCSGTAVTLDASATTSGTITSYQWYVNAVNTTDTGSVYTYIPANGDLVKCVLTTYDCDALDTAASNTITLTADPAVTPAVSITASADSVCFPTVVSFTATAVNGGPSPTFAWIKDGAEVSSGSTFSYIPFPGDIISCVLTSGAQCTTTSTATSSSITTTVHASVTPSISIFSSLGPSICAGTAEVYSATSVNGGAAPVYDWYNDGVHVATGATYSCTPASGDVISCTLVSDAICAIPDSIASSDIMMVVNPVLTPSVNITATPGDTICAGTDVTFVATAVNSGSSPAYQWNVNGVNESTSLSYSYIPAGGDIVSCIVTSSYACTSAAAAADTLVLVVNPAVVPSVSVSASTTTVTSPGQIVTFTATEGNGGTAPIYQWEVNGLPVTGANTSVFTDSFSASDSVSCLIISNAGCATPVTVVSAAIQILAALGVQTLGTLSDLTLTPNPNNGSFLIQGSATEGGILTFEVTNMLGQTVCTTTGIAANGRLHTPINMGNSLPGGIYLLSIKSAQAVRVLQFVVTK